MKQFLWSIVLSCALTACASNARSQASNGAPPAYPVTPSLDVPPDIHPRRCMVLPASRAYYGGQKLGQVDDREFTKTDCARILAKAREHLETLLASEKSDDGLAQILAHWEFYSCQFVPYVSGGKHFVFLNFYSPRVDDDGGPAPAPEPKWLVEVMDGGSAFWQIKYDVQSGRFFALMINGEARNEAPDKAIAQMHAAVRRVE